LRRLEFSPEAEADLSDIATYIARDNPGRAHSFVGELEGRCSDLLGFPQSGQARPELGPGLRSKPHGRDIIFYTPDAETVRIERILHGARDIEGEFGEKEGE
jgi:toxin ParE1/3/4